MKITLISQYYLPFIGGVEKHAQQVSHELRKRGHQVQIVAVNFGAPDLPGNLLVLQDGLLTPSYHPYDDEGVPVYPLTPSPLDRLGLLPTGVQALPVVRRHFYHQLKDWSYFWYRAVYLRRLRQILRGSDIVHSLACGLLGWTARQAAQDLNVPFVCTPFVHPGQWGDGPGDIAYYQSAHAVIGLVKSDSDYLASLGVPREKLHTIGVSPDTLPTPNAGSFRRKYQLENVPLILYVGRMMPQKGAEAVVKAASLVWERHPDARFVFAGPPSPQSEMWFRDVDNRMLYLGKVSTQEKADALAACDIFCMPSMSEILPTVYLEAWSLGKPVVGGHAHGLVDLVEGNDAGYCSSQEPAQLANVLNSLLDDEPLRSRFGSNGANLVERLYTSEAVVDQFEALYDSLVSGASKSNNSRPPASF